MPPGDRNTRTLMSGLGGGRTALLSALAGVQPIPVRQEPAAVIGRPPSGVVSKVRVKVTKAEIKRRKKQSQRDRSKR